MLAQHVSKSRIETNGHDKRPNMDLQTWRKLKSRLRHSTIQIRRAGQKVFVISEKGRNLGRLKIYTESSFDRREILGKYTKTKVRHSDVWSRPSHQWTAFPRILVQRRLYKDGIVPIFDGRYRRQRCAPDKRCSPKQKPRLWSLRARQQNLPKGFWHISQKSIWNRFRQENLALNQRSDKKHFAGILVKVQPKT